MTNNLLLDNDAMRSGGMYGGGLWIGLLSRSNAVAFTIAKSDERTAFYVRAGFSF